MIALLTSLAFGNDAPAPEAPATDAPVVETPAAPPAPPPATPDPWLGADRRTVNRPDDVVELSLEVSSLRADDERYAVFSSIDRIVSGGARVGWRPLPRLVLFGDWQRARSGMMVVTEGSSVIGGTSLGTHQLSLGAKVNVAFADEALRPYAAISGLGVFGTARFDDDTSDPESAGQLQFSGFAPGLSTVGGVELRLHAADGVAVSFHVEGGYALVAPLPLGAFGAYDLGGLVLTTGIGVRL